MKRLIVAALVGVAGVASGQTVTLSQFPPNPGVLPGGGFKFQNPGTAGAFANPPPPRAWVNGVYGGVPGARATQALTLRGPVGPLAVSVAHRVGAVAAAETFASCLALKHPACLAVGLAVTAYSFSRMKPDPDAAGPNLLLDAGVPPVPGLDTWCNSGNFYGGCSGGPSIGYCTVRGVSPADVTAKVAAAMQSAGCSVRNVGTSSFERYTSYWGWVTVNSIQSGTPTSSCPASIDPLNPASRNSCSMQGATGNSACSAMPVPGADAISVRRHVATVPVTDSHDRIAAPPAPS